MNTCGNIVAKTEIVEYEQFTFCLNGFKRSTASNKYYLQEIMVTLAYLGRKRIIISPFPVQAAAPISVSAYAPAPIIGESPTRLSGKTELKI